MSLNAGCDGDVVDLLAVEPDLAAVPQAFDIALAGHCPGGR